ncbi:MAG: NADH-quinone oxidoreductase subunit N [Candidatus Electrothrix communis]|nr:NADH-quinone oxidoreductase subunit N [Desulfobulbus sp. US4]WLE98194.1 MAG: NADH-quinone oxidoreductase subunit N [Candidatus Electrothrix communis]
MTLLLPDILLVVLAALVMGYDLYKGKSDLVSTVPFTLSWAGLCGIFIVLLCLPYDQTVLYLGGYQVTGTALLFKQVFVLSALFAVLLSRPYFTPGGNERGILKYRSEFLFILLLCTFGMFTVVSSTDLLTLFIGMELATIPLYILSGFYKKDDLSVEASTKYIIMGSASTGLLLFGYSFFYGAAGSLTFEALAQACTANPQEPLLRLGMLFTLAAIGFKLTLFPFHMWAPDVYDGAPSPVTAFISVSSKAVAIAFLLILVYGPLAAMHSSLEPILLILAAATMTAGNLGALKQTRLRRFMAYSSIAQAGYIIMAMVGDAGAARSSIIFYLFVYAAGNYAVFFIISIIGRNGEENRSGLQGLGKSNPMLAAILMLSAFSLAGIPPLAGFMGKFFLFASAAEQGYYFIVVFAALNSTISLYYYLLLVKEAYIVQPAGETAPIIMDGIQKISLFVLTAIMLVSGLLPSFSSSVLAIAG